MMAEEVKHTPRALQGLSDSEATEEAYRLYPDVVTHDYEPPQGVPKHPAGKIVRDRGPERFAFLLGYRFAKATGSQAA